MESGFGINLLCCTMEYMEIHSFLWTVMKYNFQTLRNWTVGSCSWRGSLWWESLKYDSRNCLPNARAYINTFLPQLQSLLLFGCPHFTKAHVVLQDTLKARSDFLAVIHLEYCGPNHPPQKSGQAILNKANVQGTQSLLQGFPSW